MIFGRISMGRLAFVLATVGLVSLAGLELAYGGIWGEVVSLCQATLGASFMPHGSCYFWKPSLVGLHASSDTIIALSYFSIPFGLVYYVKKRPEARFRQMFLLFGAFICLCGLTHAMAVFNIWNSAYWSSGMLKLMTGIVSLVTAIVFIRALPGALRIPLPEEMQRFRRDLERETATRAQAESELKKLGQDMVAILKGGLDGFYLISAQATVEGGGYDFRVREVNERELLRLGAKREDLVGRPIGAVFPQFEELGLEQKFIQAIERNEANEEEVELANDDEGSHWLRYQCVPSGESLALFTRDISARKREEAELKDVKRKLEIRVAEQSAELWKSENRYKLLTDFVYTAIWQSNDRGEAFGPLAGWARFTGQNQEESQGFGWMNMAPEESREVLRREWVNTISRGEAFSLEAKVWSVARQAYAPVRGYGVPVKSEKGEILEWIGALEDLSDQKMREQTLAEYSRMLAAKNKALEEFAYITSHDLQESLRKIRVYGDMLHEDFSESLPDEGLRCIEVMRRSAGHISSLLEDLLDYSRASSQEIRMTAVSLDELMASVVSDYEVRIREIGAEVSVEPMYKLTTDAALLRVIAQNLVSNALKYCDPAKGPSLRISAKRQPEERRTVLEFEDNGIGFAESLRERIFQPFQRVVDPKEYPGTGIGLAICVRAAERIGGKIDVTSTPGVGSKFMVILPDSPDEPS